MKLNLWHAQLLLVSMAILLTTGLYAQTPQLTLNPTELSFGEIQPGNFEIQSYTLTGTDILNHVVVRSQHPFYRLSPAENGNFTHRLIIPANEGIVDQIIFVRYMPMHPGVHNGVVMHNTHGVNAGVALPVSGTCIGNVNPPNILLDPLSLNFGEVNLGTYATLSYTVNASNITHRLMVGSPHPFFRISTDPEGQFMNRIMLLADNGVIQQTVYVRFMPMIADDISANIFHRLHGVNAPIVLPVTGSGVGELLPPLVTVSPDELNFPAVEPETHVTMEYNVTAENILHRLTVRAPQPFFRISLNEDSGFVNRLFLIPDDGAINQTVYVRFLPLTEGEYEGEIVHLAPGLNAPVIVNLFGLAEFGDERHNPDEEIDINAPVVIMGNYPNPFNPETAIRFSLPADSNVNLTVYNIKGQAVTKLASGTFRQGEHSIAWKGDDQYGKQVPSGMYFYNLEVNGKKHLNRMLLLK